MKIGLIIAIIVVVLGGGAVIYTQLNSDTPSNTNSTSTINAADTVPADSTERSIAQLLAAGDSVQCSFFIDDANGQQGWMMYVDGQKVRGDYEVDASGAGSGHMIRDGEYSYIWSTSQGQTTGTKIKLSSVNANSNTNSSSQELDENKEVAMDCRAWNPDASLFVPPNDVTFTDLSAQVQASTNTTVDIKAAQCEACNQAADASTIEACRVALGC